jgi:dihydroorotate dehydrogenase electron transfer subunit
MTAARLLPLAQKAAQQGADIAWFTDVPLPVLPAAYELNPLKALPDSVGWADFLALDLPLALLPKLRELLGQTEEPAGYNLACPGQALIYTSMPCGGVAECGVCAVPMRHGWKLACQDGPVFALNRLAW